MDCSCAESSGALFQIHAHLPIGSRRYPGTARRLAHTVIACRAQVVAGCAHRRRRRVRVVAKVRRCAVGCETGSRTTRECRRFAHKSYEVAHLSQVGETPSIAAFSARAAERRQYDCGEEPDDSDDNEKFYEREPSIGVFAISWRSIHTVHVSHILHRTPSTRKSLVWTLPTHPLSLFPPLSPLLPLIPFSPFYILFATSATCSTSVCTYPISLSYHARTFTSVPSTTRVIVRSAIAP